MSRTHKIEKSWKKQERRNARLLCRKGLLPVAVSQLYGEAYKENGRMCDGIKLMNRKKIICISDASL